ncbi:MAG: hypothetical protein J7621_27605 [Niastella sp.]|nr:hypothetical protein [Niastella sp.]
MGYELHIVRRNNWDDLEEESSISLEEWLTYVQSDNELELTNGYLIRFPDVEPVFHNMPGFCYWTVYPKEVNHKPSFSFGHGMISIKYPDDDIIRKMIAIANKLKARVEGDEGEFYDERYFDRKGEKAIEGSKKQAESTPWWKFW